MEVKDLHKDLVQWYVKYKRTMPWRDNVLAKEEDSLIAKAYSVWVSEIMLQQTKVETVKEYYMKWMKNFPTIKALSLASEDEVNASWAGLGYYRRAKNLHKAAKIIVNEMKYSFPSSLEGLLKLPGVGRYTAGAIASIAFDRVEPLVDGNVIRVFSRLFMKKAPRDDKELVKYCWKKAEKLVYESSPGDWNQALMELGATVCTPKKPACKLCPISKYCKVFSRDSTNIESYPLPKEKKIIPEEYYDSNVIFQEREGQVYFLVTRRPKKGLLGNQLEFVNILTKKSKETENLTILSLTEKLSDIVCSKTIELLQREKPVLIGSYTHVFSHLKHIFRIFSISLPASDELLCQKNTHYSWLTIKDMKAIGLTKSTDVCLMKVLKRSAKKTARASFFNPRANKRMKM